MPRVSGLIALWRTLQKFDSWPGGRYVMAGRYKVRPLALGALAAIVVYGFLPHVIGNAPVYVPALVACLLLLPDAKSIRLEGLKNSIDFRRM